MINLCSEIINFNLNYLGLKFVDVKMKKTKRKDENIIRVDTESTAMAGLIYKMNNTYISTMSEDLLPFRYEKIVDQGDYFENRTIFYKREKEIAQRKSLLNPNKNKEYKIEPYTRDFFSALYQLRKIAHKDSGTIWVDACGLIWKMQFSNFGTDEIKTIFGKKKAYKLKINFVRFSEKEKERSDIFTNNIVNEKNTLIMWISLDENRIPLLAIYKRKPFPVKWKLTKYEK